MRIAHIFRRDLRLEDNTALLAALEDANEVIPCFIFDPRQTNHEYLSLPGLQFLIHSINELDAALKAKGSQLFVFSGKAEEVLPSLLQHVDAVYVNEDYTPFSRKRDDSLAQLCAEQGTEFKSFPDALLTRPGTVHKDDGLPYTIFTPFHRRAKEQKISSPRKNEKNNYFAGEIPGTNKSVLYELHPELKGLLLQGGRSEGLNLLKDLPDNYDHNRDSPSASCSLLAPHHKFGTISIRESYASGLKKYGPSGTYLTELYWRDFFTHIAYHFPKIFGNAFNDKYNNIPWVENKKFFAAWCEGRTGFPIVDAGMRELNTTGYMHNRVRMIVASFLTKDLLIDWRLGEKYFAQKLLDYDPAVNNGNWQWAASTGCDAQPYFRIFNPWLQQKKFDPDCEYIKKWVPELALLPAKAIHKLAEQQPLGCEYPRPIVDHKEATSITKEVFSQA